MLQAALKVEGGCNQQWMISRARDIVASSAEKLLAVDLDEDQVGSGPCIVIVAEHCMPGMSICSLSLPAFALGC